MYSFIVCDFTCDRVLNVNFFSTFLRNTALASFCHTTECEIFGYSELCVGGGGEKEKRERERENKG